MISSREKRETSGLDKLKQAEADIATRTKDLRRLARALKLQDEKVTKLQEEKELCLREKDEAVAEVNSDLEVFLSFFYSSLSFFFFFLCFFSLFFVLCSLFFVLCSFYF